MKPQKKFGLIKMQGFAMGAGKTAAKAVPTTKKPVAKPAVFGGGGDDDDEEEMRGLRQGGTINVSAINKSIVAQQQSSAQLTAKLKEDAMQEDATMYDYDGVYDSMQEERGDKREQRKKDFDPSSGYERKEARYIQQLKKSADIRKVDEERIFQVKLKKEADADAHIYGDTEKFVTAAYKEKLSEMGRWKAEDARLKAREDATTVEGKTSMNGFYANLLTKNLAMGSGDVAKDATSAYTIGSKRNDHIRDLEAKQKEDSDDRLAPKGADHKQGGAEEAFDEAALLQKTEESERKRARVDGDGAALKDGGGGGGDTPVSSAEKRLPISTKDPPPSSLAAGSAPSEAMPLPGVSPADLARQEAAELAEAAVEAKATREASAMSAKERFLARKKAKAS
mmetsp:Transcript_40968/g.80634  ORF Transcript_40968/g.80634 Transcript_40968/m.80634 type:complete len:395 (+) Transcript_40968:112-1296(+)